MPGVTRNDAFHKLVEALSAKLGPSSGIDSEDIDPKELQALMEGYQSNEAEWGPYNHGDPSRAYTRNLVDKGNGKSNLLLLVWTPGKESPIHDHANAHCVMKILKGQLKETRYSSPTVDLNNGDERPLKLIGETIYHEDEVTYMSDKLGLHKIGNPGTEPAVSLHLYTPPNAAVYGCHIFNERTGKANHVTMCSWYSENGQRTPESSAARP